VANDRGGISDAVTLPKLSAARFANATIGDGYRSLSARLSTMYDDGGVLSGPPGSTENSGVSLQRRLKDWTLSGATGAAMTVKILIGV